MKSKNYLISGVIFYIFLIVGSISFGFSEPPVSSNVPQFSTDGFEEIETKSYENSTQINLENKIVPKDITIKQDTNEGIKETDEKTQLHSILIISLCLVVITIIVILFKIWWES